MKVGGIDLSDEFEFSTLNKEINKLRLDVDNNQSDTLLDPEESQRMKAENDRLYHENMMLKQSMGYAQMNMQMGYMPQVSPSTIPSPWFDGSYAHGMHASGQAALWQQGFNYGAQQLPLQFKSAYGMEGAHSSFASTCPGTDSYSASRSSSSAEVAGNAERTSVMMRNIPNNYTRTMLLDLLKEQGFGAAFDFFYLPIDFKKKVGLGYAFINLIDPTTAEAFRKHFTGFNCWAAKSQKVCEVTWSDLLQGVDAHVDRYKNSPIMHEAIHDDFKPVLFKDGERVPFPLPTKRIRAPPEFSDKSAN
jgi:hypothetical protein